MATGRKPSSKTTRMSSTCRPTSFRTIPAPERRAKSVAAPAGFTVNLPLEVGAVDEDYQTAFAAVILPVLAQFKPDLVIVSAGFDAHERDPLAGMRLSTAAFAAMTAELRGVAERHCQGRMALVTGGGYDLQALAASLDAVAETLNGLPQPARWPRSGVASDRGRAAAEAATHALSPYWRF